MSINANRLVSITPRVISGGSADLETNGMIITANTLISADTPAMSFSTAKEVGAFFGYESNEYNVAAQYFTGVTNQTKTIKTVWFGRDLTAVGSAWLRGGLSPDLATLKTITNGAFNISLNGSDVTITGVDLSAATSFSDVATTLTEEFTNAAVTYNTVLKQFVITSTTTGASSTIGYGSAPSSGTDLSAVLGLTQALGAVLSQGNDALTVAENMDRITGVTRNFVGFTTLTKASDANAVAYAAWADLDDDYVYFYHSNDSTLLSKATNTSSVPVSLQSYNTTACVFGDVYDAVFMLAVGASIKWDSANALKTWFAKSASGLNAKVLSDTEAEALESIRCNYIGQFATRNAEFTLLNRGCLSGTQYGFIDVLYGAIWLRARLQRGLMDCFAGSNRIPYTQQGYGIIATFIAEAVEEALGNGVIDVGLTISDSERITIMNEIDEDISVELLNNGYWYKISDPTANARADRQSPVMAMYYTYAGSVQQIEFPLTTVL